MLDGYRPDNSIVHIKNRRHLRYIDFAKDDETRFDTSNYEIKRPLPKGRNKKVTALIMMKNKDEKDKDRKIMTEFAALRPKTYSYVTDDKDETKKAKALKSKS